MNKLPASPTPEVDLSTAGIVNPNVPRQEFTPGQEMPVTEPTAAKPDQFSQELAEMIPPAETASPQKGRMTHMLGKVAAVGQKVNTAYLTRASKLSNKIEGTGKSGWRRAAAAAVLAPTAVATGVILARSGVGGVEHLFTPSTVMGMGGAGNDTVGQAVREVVAHKHSGGGQSFDINNASFNTPLDGPDTSGGSAANTATPPAAPAAAPAAPVVPELQLDDFKKGEGWSRYLTDAGMSKAEIKDLLQNHEAVQTLIDQGDAKFKASGLQITHRGAIHTGSVESLQQFHQEWLAQQQPVAAPELVLANSQGRVSIDLPDGYSAKLDPANKALNLTTPQGDVKVDLPANAVDAQGHLTPEAQATVQDTLKKAGLEVSIEPRKEAVTLLSGKLVEHAKPGETGVMPIEYNSGPNAHKLLIQTKGNSIVIDATHMTKEGSIGLDGQAMNTLPTHVALTDADGKTIFVELKDGQLVVAPDSPAGKLLADGRHVTARVGLLHDGKFHSFATALPGAKAAHLGANYELVANATDASTLAGADTTIVVKTTGGTAGTPAPAPVPGGNDPDATSAPKPAPSSSAAPTTTTTTTTAKPTATTTTTTTTVPPMTTGTTTPLPSSSAPSPSNSAAAAPLPTTETTSQTPSSTASSRPSSSSTTTTTTTTSRPQSSSSVTPTTTPELPTTTTSPSNAAAAAAPTASAEQGSDSGVPAWLLTGGALLAAGVGAAGVRQIVRNRRATAARGPQTTPSGSEQSGSESATQTPEAVQQEAKEKVADILLQDPSHYMPAVFPENYEENFDKNNQTDVQSAYVLGNRFIDSLTAEIGQEAADEQLAALKLVKTPTGKPANMSEFVDFANNLEAMYGGLPSRERFLGNAEVRSQLSTIAAVVDNAADDAKIAEWAEHFDLKALLDLPESTTDPTEAALHESTVEAMGIPNISYPQADDAARFDLTIGDRVPIMRRLARLNERLNFLEGKTGPIQVPAPESPAPNPEAPTQQP